MKNLTEFQHEFLVSALETRGWSHGEAKYIMFVLDASIEVHNETGCSTSHCVPPLDSICRIINQANENKHGPVILAAAAEIQTWMKEWETPTDVPRQERNHD